MAGENTMVYGGMVNQLPDEILVMIFSHMSFSELVDVIQKVCHRWKRVSQDARLWEDKEYYFGLPWHCNSGSCKAGETEQEAIQIFHNVPNLRKLIVRTNISAHAFHVLRDRCPRLFELNLQLHMLSCSMLNIMVETCSNIQKLTVSDLLLWSDKFSEPLSRLQHLRALRVVHVAPAGFGYIPIPGQLRRGVLRPLADGCPRLVEVSFEYLDVCEDDLRYFLNAKRNTLKAICIRWAMGRGTRSVVPLLEICADSLECVSLVECSTSPDLVWEAFNAMGSLKNLRTLLMCTPIIPPGVAALAFSTGVLSHLRVLIILNGYLVYDLDDATVIAISHGCPNMQKLSFEAAENLSDAAFSHIHNLQHLETLNLLGCSRLSGGLFAYLAGLPRLRTLTLQRMNFRKWQPGLGSILELSSLRYLSLDFSCVFAVPFDKFPGKLVNLRNLSLVRCLGDPKVRDMLTHKMPYLKIVGSTQFGLWH